ncbi:MAG: exodeoxyribonuclease VII small subunit [Candidatus Latescibacterota bacterium]|nr:MAG: exodeoxyribonuclease VII small subunit [Candidatus Latescibacterota bacterium]
MKEKGTTVDWEKSVARLEEIVRSLEGGAAGLDESLLLFEEGTKIVRALEKRLEEAELRVRKLVEREGKLEEEPFTEEKT